MYKVVFSNVNKNGDSKRLEPITTHYIPKSLMSYMLNLLARMYSQMFGLINVRIKKK
jgi:hypothetical protein